MTAAIFIPFSCNDTGKKGINADSTRASAPLSESDTTFYTALKEKLKKAYIMTLKNPENALDYDFTLNDLSGSPVSLSDFKGTVVFLNFWAIWCGPCRSEIPSMQKLYEEMLDEGFVFLAVNIGESKEDVSAFAEKAGITFPVLLDTTREVAKTYGASGIPMTWIIDTNGFIVGAAQGARSWNTSAVKEAIQYMLNREG